MKNNKKAQSNIESTLFRAEIEKALDIAWASDEQETKAYQSIIFPEGKPTPEDFILKIAELVCREPEISRLI